MPPESRTLRTRCKHHTCWESRPRPRADADEAHLYLTYDGDESIAKWSIPPTFSPCLNQYDCMCRPYLLAPTVVLKGATSLVEAGGPTTRTACDWPKGPCSADPAPPRSTPTAAGNADCSFARASNDRGGLQHGSVT